MAASAATLLTLSSPLRFWADELDWLVAFDGYDAETLLTPHNGHLIAGIRVLYEAFPDGFGAEYLPFRLVSVAAVLTCAGLFFVLARRRIGGPLALVPTLILLFFGSSSEVVVSPLGLPISLSIALGLAAFVLVERDTRPADAGAMVALVLAISFDTFGAIMAGGVAILLALDRERRAQLWVALVPIALFAAWWVWAQKFDQGIASVDNVPGVPLFVIESAAATVGAITAIGKSFGSGSESLETVTAVVFAIVALAALAVLVARARRTGSSASLWAFGLTLVGFWVAVALAESGDRQPTTARYLLFGAIMTFLVFAEAYRGGRGGRAVPFVVGVLALCLVGNAIRLVVNSDGLADRADEVGSQLAMVELAGDAGDPTFRPIFADPVGSNDIVASAGDVVAFSEEIGPLGMSVDEVKELSPELRADADFILARALRLGTAPFTDSEDLGACRTEDAGTRVPLPPGIYAVRSTDGEGRPLRFGRFGESASVKVGESGPDRVVFGIVEDERAAADPWFTDLDGPLEICPLEVSAS
jgi:hypothetical protein